MELIATTVLALVLGITVGLNVKKLKQIHLTSNSPKENDPNTNEEYNPENHALKPYFDTLEYRFLIRLIETEENGLYVKEANEILRIEKLSKENQRQRRHLFLKDLNVKLKMIFNVNECIERQSSEMDRRSKYYCIHQNINKNSLEELIADNK